MKIEIAYAELKESHFTDLYQYTLLYITGKDVIQAILKSGCNEQIKN